MTTIDNRVVEMGFDNKKFGEGVSGTLSMLDKLKSALGLSGASKGLQDVNAAAGRFNANPMVDGASRIAGSFTSMQAVAFGALANIGAKISDTAMRMGKAFTVEPITQGFQEYETNMNSIQTILANTSAAGTSLGQVNAALDEMNQYSDQTIYNFSEMAKNVGTFTAAGVDLDTATGSIKGIANLAALSGSNSQQAAGAMYQLSQEIAAGKVTLMGWNSVVNAGMGGTVFQRALAETAVAMGKIDKSAMKLEGPMKNVKINGEAFRDSISAEGGKASWLTSDVLTTTLQNFTGDMSEAELMTQGFTKTQAKSIMLQAEMAKGAATEVKTFTGLMDTLKEGVASGWSTTFRTVIGDFEEAKKLFTSVSNAVGGFLGGISERRNEMLAEWKKQGGRDALIEGLGDAFGVLGRILGPIGAAFRDVFPATTAERLVEMTKNFAALMAELQPSNETVSKLRRTFAGLFAILGIGWEVIKAVAGFLGDMFMGIEEGDKGILKTTAAIGDFLVGLYKAIKEGEGLTNFFDKLRDALFKVINPIKDFAGNLGGLFEGINTGALGGSLGKVITNLLTFGEAAEKTGGALDKVKKVGGSVMDFLGGLASAIGDFFSPIAEIMASAFQDMDYDQVMQGIQTGLLGGLVVVIKQLGGMFKGLDLFQNAGGGIMEKIRDGLDGLTGTLSAMQANLKASMLLKIAGAIALLAVSVVLLAGVDGPALARATAALTVMFIQLGAAMAVFQKIGTVASMAKLVVMGAALILLSTAILILTGAVKVLASMGWEELAKGLGALAVIIGVLIVASKGIDKQRGAILRSAASLILLGFAVKNLVAPIKDLGAMDWDVLRQGLIGVGGLLVGLAIFTRLAAANKGGVLQSAGLLILAFAISELAKSVEVFGKMSIETISKGFAAMGAGIITIGLALKAMPKSPMVILTALALGKVAESLVSMAKAFKVMETITWESIGKGMVAMTGIMALITAAIRVGKRVNPIQSAALYVVASAVKLLGETLIAFGNMDYDEIGRGLTAMGGALAIMSASISLMSGSVTGAAALVLVAAALGILTPILITLGTLPIITIVTGLAALAGIFGVLGLAGLLLGPVLPVLMGLGVAITLIGGAMFLAGAGLALFSVGLTAIALAGGAGIAALVATVSALVGLIPMIATQIGVGLVALLKAIGDSGAELTDAFVKIVGALLDGVVRLAPKIGAVLLVLLKTGLTVLAKGIPMFVSAGLQLIVGILRGIANNIGKIVDAAADIIVNFLNGISRNLPRIIQAGIELIISFVNGLAEGIRNNSTAMGEAGGNLATAIIEGMVKGIMGGVGKVVDAAKDMAKQAWNAAKDWLGIASPSKKFAELGKYSVEGFLKGLTGSRQDINDAVVGMLEKMNAAMTEASDKAKTARENIAKANEKNTQLAKDMANAQAALKKAQSAKNPDTRSELARIDKIRTAQAKNNKELAKQNTLLEQAESLHKKVSGAKNNLKKNLDDETERLKKLADQYEINEQRLEDATKALEDARKTRDDYNKSLRDQYGQNPEVAQETKLVDYIADLEKRIVDTQNFAIAIQEIRRLGLNDEMYKQLLAKGPEAMPFVQELLEGGKIRIDQLNTLGASLDVAAGNIADSASTSLYQAGVNAAEGLVRGLEAEQHRINALMQKIATDMVETVRKKLGIKSPSRVFEEMGNYTGQGFANGLTNTASAVEKSAENVGQSAIDGMKKTITGLGALIQADVDVNPVIAPVLDLSDIRKGAAGIGSLLEAQPISLDVVASRAASASAGYTANRDAEAELSEEGSGDSVTFIQNNSSPKALSNAELYRQTNNQISRAKGALAKT